VVVDASGEIDPELLARRAPGAQLIGGAGDVVLG
jgi:hypothetical protein